MRRHRRRVVGALFPYRLLEKEIEAMASHRSVPPVGPY
jgi:hypothetical protein